MIWHACCSTMTTLEVYCLSRLLLARIENYPNPSRLKCRWTPTDPRAVRKISKTLVADDDHLRAGNYLPRGIDFGTSPSYYWIPREICFIQTRNHHRILPKPHSPVPSAAFSGPIKDTVSTCSRPAICNVILFSSRRSRRNR